jgi:hypothetical protein
LPNVAGPHPRQLLWQTTRPGNRSVSGQYFPASQVGEQEQTDDRRQPPTGVEDNN